MSAGFPDAWTPHPGERVPTNWHPREDGFQYMPHPKGSLDELFAETVMVRAVFGSWGVFKRKQEMQAQFLRPGRQSMLRTIEVWEPVLDGRAFPSAVAAMLAAEFEFANESL